jgi:hypothetical protein
VELGMVEDGGEGDGMDCVVFVPFDVVFEDTW